MTSFRWVALKALNISYLNPQTVSFTMYPYYGNWIQVPRQQPSLTQVYRYFESTWSLCRQTRLEISRILPDLEVCTRKAQCATAYNAWMLAGLTSKLTTWGVLGLSIGAGSKLIHKWSH